MKRLGHDAAAESFALTAVLAAAGGFIDAYSFLARGHVFANAETGNMVLLGVYLLKGEGLKALSYLVPVLSYALGVWVVEVIRARLLARNPRFHWRNAILGFEVLIVAVTAFLPEQLNMLACVMLAFVCAMQYESFRKVRGNAFASTMCTGNLRSGTENLFRYRTTGDLVARDKMRCYYGIIAIFIAGAAFGGLCCSLLDKRATLACAGILVVAFVLLAIFGSEEQTDDGGDL